MFSNLRCKCAWVFFGVSWNLHYGLVNLGWHTSTTTWPSSLLRPHLATGMVNLAGSSEVNGSEQSLNKRIYAMSVCVKQKTPEIIWDYLEKYEHIYIYECSCISIITCWRERYCIHYSFYFVFRYKNYQHLGSQAIIYIIQPTPNEAHPKLSITIWQCRYIYIYHIS